MDSFRDWGHAKDYVRAMWLMLQRETPGDYVISTGSTHSVRDFLKLAFGCVNLDPSDYVNINPDLFRPAEVDYLKGDSSKAKNELWWNNDISFNDLVIDMIQNDIAHV